MDIPANRDWIDNPDKMWLPFAQKIARLKRDNVGNIAKMLAAFSRGCSHVLMNNEQKTFELPLVIDTSDDPRVALACYEWEKRDDIVTDLIVLSGRHFRYQSWFSLDEQLDIRHDDGVPNYIGSRINRYILAGAEEMDHAHFQRSNDYYPSTESNLLLRQDVYDSSPVEFRSLHTRLNIAIALGMDESTIEVIRNRIEAASLLIK